MNVPQHCAMIPSCCPVNVAKHVLVIKMVSSSILYSTLFLHRHKKRFSFTLFLNESYTQWSLLMDTMISYSPYPPYVSIHNNIHSHLCFVLNIHQKLYINHKIFQPYQNKLSVIDYPVKKHEARHPKKIKEKIKIIFF